MAKILIKKDWEWYLAQVVGHKNLFAFGLTKKQAYDELLNVIEMIMDYHLEQVETERKIKNHILWTKSANYAV